MVDKAWVPLGTKDYASVIAKIPKDVDALLVVLGGSDAVNFLTQYEQAGGNKPMVGGSITVDQTVLNYKGKRRESLLGTPPPGRWPTRSTRPSGRSSSPTTRPTSRTASRARRCSPTCTTSTPRRRSTALDAVKGDLSERPEGVPRGAAEDQLQGPGRRGEDRRQPQRRRHDLHHRSGEGADGSFYNKVVKTVPNITQTLGLPEAEFKKMGLGSRDVPDCRK